MIDTIVAKGMIPDFFLRKGIQNLVQKRLKEISSAHVDLLEKRRQSLIKELKLSPIAIETDLANDQHYQVPSGFFEKVLGENMKYSCAFFEKGNESLKEAESKMLKITCERAQIKDGMKILELGCGWGAITLYMAKQYPNSAITAVSNSKTQREFILNKAQNLGLSNVEVITANMIDFDTDLKFDRVVSVEMFEHMRNYEKLLEKISKWLNDEGKLFVHIFVHSKFSYKFEVNDETDWMSKYFFSGGIMPSEHLLYYFQKDLSIKNHWTLSGRHYAQTARKWLNNMDDNKSDIMKVFNDHYGPKDAMKWFNYWRVFFMSCEELWAFDDGREWLVGHYLFEK